MTLTLFQHALPSRRVRRHYKPQTMNKILIWFFAACLLISTGSCTHRLTDFTVISTKNVPIGDGIESTFVKGNSRVKGKHTAHTVLVIPMGYPNMKEAIDRAIESAPGSIGLADGVVKSSGWSCLVYGQNSFVVEGTPIYPGNVATSDNNFHYRQGNTQPAYQQYQPAQQVQQAQPVQQVQQAQPAHSSNLVFYHDVKQTDTLASIAQMYNVTVADIVKWNHLTSDVKSGDKIVILISE